MSLLERYQIVKGSRSAHCCFEFTVVDTYRFTEETNPALRKTVTICECFDQREAELIVAALNFREKYDGDSDQFLKNIVDWTWIHATEGAHWPSAKTTAELIQKAKERGPTQEDAGRYIEALRSVAQPASPSGPPVGWYDGANNSDE